MYGIFTYIWVIFRVNVGKFPYMEHMGNDLPSYKMMISQFAALNHQMVFLVVS